MQEFAVVGIYVLVVLRQHSFGLAGELRVFGETRLEGHEHLGNELFYLFEGFL